MVYETVDDVHFTFTCMLCHYMIRAEEFDAVDLKQAPCNPGRDYDLYWLYDSF